MEPRITAHSTLRILRHVPNMVVMAPKDENELQHMMKTCVSYDGPASVRYPRGVSLGVPMDPEPNALPIGKGELLREGTDVAIVAIGVTGVAGGQGGRAVGARRYFHSGGECAFRETAWIPS